MNSEPPNKVCLLQDKAMMDRWGLTGMGSFEQKGVKRKEISRRGAEPIDSSVEFAV